MALRVALAVLLLGAACSRAPASATSTASASTTAAGAAATGGTTAASATGSTGASAGSTAASGATSTTGGSSGTAASSGSGTTGSSGATGTSGGPGDGGLGPLHVTSFAHLLDGLSPRPLPITPAVAARYIDWAETANPAPLHDAGMHTYLYADDDNLELPPDGGLGPYFECDFAHACPATGACASGSCPMGVSVCSASSVCAASCAGERTHQGPYVMSNPASQHILQLWQAHMAANHFDAGQFDAVFRDAFGTFQYDGSPTPCGSRDDFLDAGTHQLAAAGAPVIFNGGADVPYPSPCYFDGGCLSPNLVAFGSANVIGARAEGCYGASHFACEDAGAITQVSCRSAGSSVMPSLNVWARFENTALWFARHQKTMICMENNRAPASCAVRERLYYEASFLLTYAPPFTVAAPLWSWQGSFSQIEFFPEELLVPTSPLVPAPAEIDGLRDPGGAFVREYAACYFAGAPVGPCAVVVNSDCVDHPWPALQHTYRHTLQVEGESFFDGGLGHLDGGPPPALVPLLTGIIALP